MDTVNINTEQLEFYLLGLLPPQAAEQLEEQYFCDDALFGELQRVEASLVEQYVQGELPAVKMPHFVGYYLTTPSRKERVAVGKDELVENFLEGRLLPEQERRFRQYFLAQPENRQLLEDEREMRGLAQELANAPAVPDFATRAPALAVSLSEAPGAPLPARRVPEQDAATLVARSSWTVMTGHAADTVVPRRTAGAPDSADTVMPDGPDLVPEVKKAFAPSGKSWWGRLWSAFRALPAPALASAGLAAVGLAVWGGWQWVQQDGTPPRPNAKNPNTAVWLENRGYPGPGGWSPTPTPLQTDKAIVKPAQTKIAQEEAARKKAEEEAARKKAEAAAAAEKPEQALDIAVKLQVRGVGARPASAGGTEPEPIEGSSAVAPAKAVKVVFTFDTAPTPGSLSASLDNQALPPPKYQHNKVTVMLPTGRLMPGQRYKLRLANSKGQLLVNYTLTTAK